MDKAPDAFRTISEVAEELDIPHVLRFWETRCQIKPMKRSGGRRYYRPRSTCSGIRRLLYGGAHHPRRAAVLKRERHQIGQASPTTSAISFNAIEDAIGQS